MFKPITFSSPQGVAGIAQGLAKALQGQAATVLAGAGALGGLGLAMGGQVSAAVQEARTQATQGLAAPCGFLAITPQLHGVGSKKGEYAYLTPVAAIQNIAKSMGAAKVDGANALVLILFAAPTPGELAQQLEAFTKVYPVKELEQASRRAAGLARLESAKFTIPQAPAYPAWGEACPQTEPKGQEFSKALGSMLATGEAGADAQSPPLAKLAAFAAKQAAKLAEKTKNLQSLGEGMAGSGPGWFGVALDGSAADIARALAKAAPPLDEAYKCTAAVCWFGAAEQVQYYKEAFGL